MSRKYDRQRMTQLAREHGIDIPTELAEFFAEQFNLLDKNGLVPDWIDTLAVDVVYEMGDYSYLPD